MTIIFFYWTNHALLSDSHTVWRVIFVVGVKSNIRGFTFVARGLQMVRVQVLYVVSRRQTIQFPLRIWLARLFEGQLEMRIARSLAIAHARGSSARYGWKISRLQDVHDHDPMEITRYMVCEQTLQ